jgi:hypothetical protein
MRFIILCNQSLHSLKTKDNLQRILNSDHNQYYKHSFVHVNKHKYCLKMAGIRGTIDSNILFYLIDTPVNS